MGAIISRFRKEPTTEIKLEQLEEKIKKIEEYGVNTQERKKRFVGTFLAVAVGIYVIAIVSILYFYFPVTWKERILYFIPFLIFPYVIILLRRLFTWYFQRKLNKNSATLTKLRAEKKEILEQVMDKETYKVAVNLLARFGDRSTSNRLSLGAIQRPTGTTPLLNNQSTSLRSLARPTTNQQQFGTISPLPANRNPTSSMPSNSLNVTTSQSLNVSTRTPQGSRGDQQQLRRRTPFPIVNQAEKSIFDRCLDLLIGDGPQDRFAVICRECHSHNGMALKEEFDYIAYRCAFCNAMNPARKTRPVGPRLSLLAPTDSPHSIRRSGESSNSSTTPDASDDEEDLEHPRRRVQLRLTESTVNHSESPEITNHDATVTAAPTSNEITEPSPVEDSHEPMDITEEDNAVRQNVASEEEKKTN